MSVLALDVGRTDDVVQPALEVKKVLAGMAAVRFAYQPIVDLDSGAVVGYEALARFGTTLRSPVPYLAAADELGRRDELEALLLQQAIAERAQLPPHCFVAVNVTPGLLSSPAVWSALRGVPDLEGVVLELTEHSPVDNMAGLRRRVDALRECGALLALDDVGAGWSGLQQIAALRPDVVKLDRALVHGVHGDEVKHALAELLRDFTVKVGGRLLAEGIEREVDLELLASLGVHLAQGWLLGRPRLSWRDVPESTAQLLARPQVRQANDLSALVREVPVVTRPAALGFLPDGLPDHALLVDGERRVEAVWVRNLEQSGPSGWSRTPTVVTLGSDRAEVLRLAMARPGAARFDPLVVVDAEERVLGLVHLSDLVMAVVDSR
ncbi:MAG: EAL domain-containing protein [Mycobacteriales bacterium]